ncbi:hypothetical protein HOY80DRAFT_1099626 [Tuber brumale]|nr:hypothetical protein HOY80DRAFT_1099626 [Tuber brumale]
MSYDSDKENVDPALLCDPAPLSLRYTAPSLPHTPPGSTNLPEAPDIPRGIVGTPTEIDSDDIPLLDRTVTPIESQNDERSGYSTPEYGGRDPYTPRTEDWPATERPEEITDLVVRDETDGFAQPAPSSRICSKYLLVTYPRADGLSTEMLVSVFRRHKLELVLGQERHLDAGIHYHAFARRMDGKRFETRNMRYFDIQCGDRVYHPNICTVFRTPEKAYDYIRKEGNIIVEDFKRETGVRGGRSGGEGSAALLACFDAVTKQQFLDDLRLAAPRLYLASYNNVRCVAEQHYPTVETEYLSPYGSSSWKLPTVVEDWCGNFLSMYNNDSCKGFLGVRPLSLVLYGPTRTGKTAWARSLGSHLYFSGMFNLSLYREMYRYVVFDDVEFSRMDIFKCWFGAQEEFTATDKYCKKTQVKHGRPMIGCFNRDPRDYSWADREWMEGNCIFVYIGENLYRS